MTITITDSRPASEDAAPMRESPDAPNAPAARVEPAPADASPQGLDPPGPAADPGSDSAVLTLLDPALCLAADILDDIERVRIANENRLRQLTRTETDSDGLERGFGLDETHPDVARLAAMVETLRKVEHDATLNLQRKVRKHPLGEWAKAQRGVGEKQIARLLAAVGDPYINSAKDQPRTVSALWAYCGLHVLPAGHSMSDAQTRGAGGDQHGDPGQSPTDALTHGAGAAAKRRKGERANWSTKAKMRAYLIAESCVKQLSKDCRDGHRLGDAHVDPAAAAHDGQGGHACRVTHERSAALAQTGEQDAGQSRRDAQSRSACACSPYRVTYDQRRAHTATTHPEWTDGHSHNDALRVASKAILRDLWRAARDWHLRQVTQ